MIKAVIFDMDDTLFSEREYVMDCLGAVAEVAARGNADDRREYGETLKRFAEESVFGVIDRFLDEYADKSFDKDELLTAYRDHIPTITPFPDVSECLGECKRRGYKLALLTDGRPDRQWAKINALGIKDFFDRIVITDELGGPQFRKPNPYAYELICRDFSLRPDEVAVVGDNPAKEFCIGATGMTTVRIFRGVEIYRDVPYKNPVKENYRIASLGELFALPPFDEASDEDKKTGGVGVGAESAGGQNKKKVLMLCNTSGSVALFRKPLIAAFIERGYAVDVVAFNNEREDEIRATGADFILLNDSNKSVNPFKALSLKSKYYKIIRERKPDLVLAFMLKPNIYGALAAKKAGVPAYCTVEGAGDVFVSRGLKWKLIRAYVCAGYKKAFAAADRVFFLNAGDRAEFVERGLVDPEKTSLVEGIGVDLARFAYKPLTNRNTFLMVARMLKTKGVREFCEAARAVKRTHPNAVFNYVGGAGDMSVEDIKEYIDDGSVNYLGETADTVPYYGDAAVLVLPSYREGFPVAVMEAAAVGRPAIVSDVNGCRDAVVGGETGLRVKPRDSEELAAAMRLLLDDPQAIERLGKAARAHAERHFDRVQKADEMFAAVTQGKA